MTAATTVPTSPAARYYRTNLNAFTFAELFRVTRSLRLTLFPGIFKLFGRLNSPPGLKPMPVHWRDLRCEENELSEELRGKIRGPAGQLEALGFRKLAFACLRGFPNTEAGGIYFLDPSGRHFAFVFCVRVAGQAVGETVEWLEQFDFGLASRTEEDVTFSTAAARHQFPCSPHAKVQVRSGRSLPELIHDHQEWVGRHEGEFHVLRLRDEADFEAAYDRAEDLKLEYWVGRGVYVPAGCYMAAPATASTGAGVKLYRVSPSVFSLREIHWMTGSVVLTAIGGVLKLLGVFTGGPERYQLPGYWRDSRCDADELSEACRMKLEAPAGELEQLGFRRVGFTRLLGRHPNMEDAGGLYLVHASGRQFGFVLHGRSRFKVGEVTRTIEHLETGLVSRTTEGVSHVTTGKKKRFPPSPGARIRISKARSPLELVHDHEEWIDSLAGEASFLRLSSDADFEAAYDAAERANCEYWIGRGVYVEAGD